MGKHHSLGSSELVTLAAQAPSGCGGCRAYLEALAQYLLSFQERTQPLQSISKQLGKLEADFAAAWEEGRAAGWPDRGEGSPADSDEKSAAALDVEAFDSVEELEQLGELSRAHA